MAGGIFLFSAFRVSCNDLEIDHISQVVQPMYSGFMVLLIVSVYLPDAELAKVAAKELEKIANYKPVINANTEEGSFSRIRGKIEFKNVNFRYKSGSDLVLNNLNFELEAGQTLGITGYTGSGKSTICQLLLRFYNPISGQILIDNKKIEDYNLNHLRNSIGWVSQEPVLFKGSILYNLRMGCSSITETDALNALRKAECSDVINLYRLDSDVGIRGGFFSGGQKQRIAIARAIVKNPAVLILDEATSALDNTVEEKIRQNLLQENFGIIAIAHRIQSIRGFNNIVVLDQGFVVEQGSPKKLSKAAGFFSELDKDLESK